MSGRPDSEPKTDPAARLLAAQAPVADAQRPEVSRTPTHAALNSRLSRAQPLSSRSMIGPYQLIAAVPSRGPLELFLANRVTRFGSVHRAVLKRARDDAGSRRLFDEARALASLSHPSLPAILDLGQEDGAHWLARSFLDGADLASLIAKLRLRREALPLELAAWMTTELLRALAVAHAGGGSGERSRAVLHLALCPESVVLTRTGQITLVDFGKPPPGEREWLPKTSLVDCPEAPYLAPELVLHRTGDARTDVYMAGMLLFELLVGRACYRGRSVGEVLDRISKNEQRLERLEQEGVPVELRRVVERAVSESPARRFSSAGEMANALESWVMQTNLHPSAWILSAFCAQHELLDALPPMDLGQLPALSQEPGAGPAAPRSSRPATPTPRSQTTPMPPRPSAPSEAVRPEIQPSAGPRASVLPRAASAPRASTATVPVASEPPAARQPTVPPAKLPRSSTAPLPSRSAPAAPAAGRGLHERATEPPGEVAVERGQIPADPTAPLISRSRASAPPPMAAAAGTAWSGDLASTRASEVVGRLVAQRVTGRLELRAEPLWKHLLLANGQAVAIRSNVGMESIGEQLVRAKLIQRADLDRALRESPRGEAGVLDRLLAASLVDPARLAAELGRNIAEGLTETFSWRHGLFEFVPVAVEMEALAPAIDLIQLVARDAARARPGARSTPPDASGRRPSVEPGPQPSLVDAIELARQVHQATGSGRVDEVAPDGEGRRRR